MCECRYYGKCAGNCDSRGLVLGFGNETYDCDCFSPLPDVDALLTMADEIEDAVRNTNKTTDLAVRFAEIIYTIAKEIRSACGQVLTYDADFDPETDSPAYCESCGSRVTGIGEPLDE